MANLERRESTEVNPEIPQQFTGILHLFSETGTEGGYWAFQDERFITRDEEARREDRWSYEGLHILEDGDNLTIFSKENPEDIVWNGEISLQKHPSFTEHARGLFIHADQTDIDRDTWAEYFLGEHKAKLVSRRELKTKK